MSDTGADVRRGGTAYGTITARNTGTRPCTITGYPRLTLTVNGEAVQTRLSRAAGAKPATLTLTPGATASFGFSHSTYRLQRAHCDTITGARIYDPHGSSYRNTKTSFQECEGITPSGLRPVPITVGPFQPGARATLT